MRTEVRVEVNLPQLPDSVRRHDGRLARISLRVADREIRQGEFPDSKLEKDDTRINDKWGPAGAVRVADTRPGRVGVLWVGVVLSDLEKVELLRRTLGVVAQELAETLAVAEGEYRGHLTLLLEMTAEALRDTAARPPPSA